MSSAPLKANLPDFFQSAGYSGNNTLLSQLEDFELGGLEDDDEDNGVLEPASFEHLNELELQLNDEVNEDDDEAFSDFHNKIADITKSPSRNSSMPLSAYGAAIPPPLFGTTATASTSTASSVKTKTNALDMLKIEMGLKNVGITSDNSNNISNNNNNANNNDNFNFMFPTDTHLPPGLTPPGFNTGADRIQHSSPAAANLSTQVQQNMNSNNSNNSNMTIMMPRHLQQAGIPPSPQQPPYNSMPLPPHQMPSSTSFTPPLPPGPMLTTMPQQQLFQPPPPPPQPFVIPRSNMMRTSDVRFVLNKVLQPMESPDPYSDDFYYIQFHLKRNAAIYEKRRRRENMDTTAAVPVVPSFAVPLPTWKDTKQRIKSQILESQRSLDDRMREWEEREQVLGHQTRSNIARPRELLSLAPSHSSHHTATASCVAGNKENGSSDGSTTDDSTPSAPSVLIATVTADDFRPIFSTRLWAMRRAVQRAHEALQTVQELEHLLRTPLIWENVEARQEVLAEVDEAVGLLAQAIGIRSVKSLHVVEEGYMGLGYAHGHIDSAADITIDGSLIAALLQSAKGKKLIVRAFGPLPPEKRWLLVPPILTRVLQTDHAASSTEEKEAEVILIQTCVHFFKQAYMHANSLKTTTSTTASTTATSSQYMAFVKQLLTHFRQCVKSVLVTFMEKNQLRKVLLIDEALLTESTTSSSANDDNNSHPNKKNGSKNKNHRLGLFQSLIATGDQLANDLSVSESNSNTAATTSDNDEDRNASSQQQQWASADDWRQIKETFLAMIDDE